MSICINGLDEIELPQELTRKSCAHCCTATANVECPECRKCYCSACVHSAHGVSAPDGTIKSEYSEGSHAHLDKIIRCNVCLQCRDKDVEFYCADCNMYQCEICCASYHLVNATDHSYFAVQGSRGSMLQYSKWSVELFEMARSSRRELIAGSIHDQDNLGETTPPEQSKIVEETQETSQISLGNVVMESENEVQNSPDDAQLAQMEKLAITNEAKNHPVEERTESNTSNTDIQMDDRWLEGIVDLTVEDNKTSAPRDLPERSVKQEAVTHNTQTSLQPQASATEGASGDVQVAEFDGLDSDDPIKIALLEEYNQLSDSMAKLSQQVRSINEQMKAYMLGSANMQQMLQCRRELENTHTEAAEISNKRNIVVAKLLVYSSRDPSKLEEMLSTVAVDSEHAQSTIHRKCITLESTVHEKRKLLRTHKTQMDETIRMKAKESYAEVARIAGDIQKLEEEIINLDKARLEELEQLLVYSKKVREAAMEMLMPVDES
uniref:Uncharacterized protein AlNc14C5G745 n=1 Tax=Albugo laibachii Nc14 TaxID=890382 RepID=F0W0W5_9STRA|nr:conserved hypothetical protein [Albugo laibachii Nc14]|eukprot:CCA14689.1 conserved hypothetical protein [Albugo laibachii Nc14]